MTIRKTVALVVGGIALCVSQASQAAPYYSSPGLNCVPAFSFSGSQAALYYDWGGVANQSSTSDLAVYCPTPLPSTGVGYPQGVSVWAHSGNPGDGSSTILCQYAVYTASQTGWWSSSQTPANNQDNTMSWTNPLGTSALSGSKTGAIVCVLPHSNGSYSNWYWVYGGSANWGQ
jgi:hypothetical protein